jgi:NADPH:quinone reductase-like Zn-dependent oxidoreductase
VQYAKAAGFETIAVSHSSDKDKMIRDLGADVSRKYLVGFELHSVGDPNAPHQIHRRTRAL